MLFNKQSYLKMKKEQLFQSSKIEKLTAEKAPVLDGKITIMEMEPFKSSNPERKSKRIQKKLKKTENQHTKKLTQHLKILRELDFDNMFVCGCNDTQTIFFTLKDFKSHVEKCHITISYPNSTHDFRKLGIRPNKYYNQKVLLQFKQKQITKKILKIQDELGIQSKVPLPTIPKKKQILEPLPLGPIYYHRCLRKNFRINKLFCWQDLAKNKNFNHKILNFWLWYCSYCKIIFPLYTSVKSNFQLSLIQHMKNHNSSKVLKLVKYWQQEKQQLEQLKKNNTEMITCPCTKPIFKDYDHFYQHVMSQHVGEALAYSSHLVKNKKVYLNPNFSQEEVVRSQLIPAFYLCGFCHQSNQKKKIFLSPASFIHHLFRAHQPPYHHPLHSHFFNYEKQVYLDRIFQSDGLVQQNLSLPEQQSEPEEQKNVPVSLNLPREKIIESLSLLRVAEKHYIAELPCSMCKRAFLTKEQFVGEHEAMPEEKKMQHYASTHFCFIKLCGDFSKIIIITTDMKYISKYLQSQLIYYLCSCYQSRKGKKITLASFINHLLIQHEKFIYLKNDNY